MKDHLDAWRWLVNQARRAPDDAPVPAPPGFATRVVARAWARRSDDYIGLFSLRALGLAAALLVVCAVVNYPALTADPADELAADPVGELLAEL